MRAYTLFLFLLVFVVPLTSVSAQKFDDHFFRENLEKKYYAIDSEASAIVLYEKGSTEILPTGDSYEMLHHVRRIVKVLKASSVNEDLLNIKLLYKYHLPHGMGFEYAKATTYNLDNNNIVKNQLEKTSIYKRKLDVDYNEASFSLPAVRDGSVIDYEFALSSDECYILPRWYFQQELPKLRSEYELSAPVTFNYKEIFQGDNLFKQYAVENIAEQDHASRYKLMFPLAINNRYSVRWVEKNVAGIKEEPYISNVSNYGELLELQISGYMGGENRDNEQLFTSWTKLDEELWRLEGFGKFIDKPNKFLDDIVDSLTLGIKDPLSKARIIYSFVKTSFSCNDKATILAKQSMKELFKNKSGSVGEINMLLTCMLRKADLPAFPAVLSKSGHLRCYETYPIINRFNYVVSVLDIKDSRYWLDACDKNTPFGTLPEYCYNGYVRIVDKEKGVGENLTGDDITDRNLYYIKMQLSDDSASTIDIVEKPGIFKSHDLRDEWDKDTALMKKYIKEQVKGFPGDVGINSFSVQNLQNPDTNLIVSYTLSTRRGLKNINYLDTDYLKFFSDNPFIAMKRTMPIEFPYKINDQCILSVRLPNNYVAEELPAPVSITYGGEDMSFKHLLSYDSTLHLVSVNTRLITKRATYPKIEYDNLRLFFEKMVQAQEQKIVLKRKF